MTTTNIPQPTIRIQYLENIQGFMGGHEIPDTYGWAMVKGFFVSDQSGFYKHINQITKKYLSGLRIDEINNFLILHHADYSVDVFVNNFNLLIQVMPNRNVADKETVYFKDIIDIKSIVFENIKISQHDSIIWGFRVDWRFGLYVDIRLFKDNGYLENPIKLDELQLELGRCYKRLAYKNIFETISQDDVLERMFNDGWFPFLNIITGEFVELSEYYKDAKLIENEEVFSKAIDYIAGRFDSERIENIISKWWDKDIFAEKQPLIQAGINAYLQYDESGYINCISNLYSQIEGIIRITCNNETGLGKKLCFSNLSDYIRKKAEEKFDSRDALGFPSIFYTYLKNVFLKDFDLNNSEIYISRHTTGHGVAKAEDYTKIRAIQAILILDQIYFYLP